MGGCLQSVSLNTCTMDIHTAVDPGYTLWAPDIFNTCTLDTHTTVHPGYAFWAPAVFKVYH